MAGGSSPQTTSCSPGWVGLSEAVLQIWGWIGEVGQDQGLLSLLASLVRSRIPSVAGLSGRSWGSQGTRPSEHHALRVGVLGLNDQNAIPEAEPQKCLNLSPFWPLLTNYLRVLGFLFLSFFPPLYPSMDWGRVCLVDLDFHSTWPLHVTFSSGSFIVLECKVEHFLDIFFYIFCKALHARGCREVFIKHLRTFFLSIRKQKSK